MTSTSTRNAKSEQNEIQHTPQLAARSPDPRPPRHWTDQPSSPIDAMRAPIRRLREADRDAGSGRRERGSENCNRGVKVGREAGEPDLGAGRAAGEAAGEEVPDLAEAEVRCAVAPRDGGRRWGRVPPRAAHGGDGAKCCALGGEGEHTSPFGRQGGRARRRRGMGSK
jgi:hypothetical protein